MSLVRKHISFTPQHDSWIKSRLESGDYTSESEYVRELIRQDMHAQKDYESRLKALRKDINSAWDQVENGETVAFNPKETLSRAKERLAK